MKYQGSMHKSKDCRAVEDFTYRLFLTATFDSAFDSISCSDETQQKLKIPFQLMIQSDRQTDKQSQS